MNVVYSLAVLLFLAGGLGILLALPQGWVSRASILAVFAFCTFVGITGAMR